MPAEETFPNADLRSRRGANCGGGLSVILLGALNITFDVTPKGLVAWMWYALGFLRGH